MKKLLALILCLGMSVMTIGCSGDASGGASEDTSWINESAAKIDKELTGGQFVLDGVVYEFPMDLQYWLDNGWHVSNNYGNIDEFTLGPGESSTEFELFNEAGDYVEMSVLNNTNEDQTVEGCMVYSLHLPLTEVDPVFPQGITKRSEPADIKKAYGNPLAESKEIELMTISYTYETEESWKCMVDIDVYDNDYTTNPCTDVTYYIMSFDSIWEALIEDKGLEEACRIYMDAAMNASFTGDTTAYVDYCIDSQTNADALYQSELDYYADFLMYYVEINTDYIEDEDREKFVEIAKKVLSKVEWKVKSVEDETYSTATMVVELYPTNFLSVIEEDLIDAVNEFYAKYENVNFETMPEAEYIEVEKEYTEMMIEALEKNVDKAGTLDAVEKEYQIAIRGSILSDDDWTEIDDIIMDVAE